MVTMSFCRKYKNGKHHNEWGPFFSFPHPRALKCYFYKLYFSDKVGIGGRGGRGAFFLSNSFFFHQPFQAEVQKVNDS